MSSGPAIPVGVNLTTIGVDSRCLADLDTPQVKFVDIRDELVAARTVDLSKALAALQRLAQLNGEAA